MFILWCMKSFREERNIKRITKLIRDNRKGPERGKTCPCIHIFARKISDTAKPIGRRLSPPPLLKTSWAELLTPFVQLDTHIFQKPHQIKDYIVHFPSNCDFVISRVKKGAIFGEKPHKLSINWRVFPNFLCEVMIKILIFISRSSIITIWRFGPKYFNSFKTSNFKSVPFSFHIFLTCIGLI